MSDEQDDLFKPPPGFEGDIFYVPETKLDANLCEKLNKWTPEKIPMHTLRIKRHHGPFRKVIIRYGKGEIDANTAVQAIVDLTERGIITDGQCRQLAFKIGRNSAEPPFPGYSVTPYSPK